MHEVNDRSRDIGEFVPAPDDDMLICRCEEITKGEIRKAVHEGMWTMTEIRRYLRDNNSIRVSRSVRDLAYKAMQFKEKYIREKGREPTIDIIAKELEVEREDIAYSFDAVQDPVSLQEPVYNDGAESIYIMDQVKDSKNTDEAWIENMTIKQIMKKLNDKEKMIITKRFFDGRTQMEVADEIGISQAQVSRLEKNAIEHIKRLYK